MDSLRKNTKGSRSFRGFLAKANKPSPSSGNAWTANMIPARGRVLVRKVETGESLPGAKIVLLDKTREELTAQQAEIVVLGAPSYCENDGCERTHIIYDHISQRTHVPYAKAGDWVLLAPRSLTEGPDNCYFVNQDDVLAVLST